jgi:carbamoyltransferase
LEEEASEWFLMRSIKNISPFMMYAVRVLSDKEEMIPAVTHVDHTCRVQTVNEEQNKIFYDLIKAFKELTGVPILFNTSFNLAGHPLVESAHDALVTLTNSEIDYVFFPDANVLVSKK